MNTLHAPLPTAEEPRHPLTPLSRPTFVERAAMRLGLWLLLWGRHRARRRLTRDQNDRQLFAARVRRDRERALADAALAFPLR